MGCSSRLPPYRFMSWCMELWTRTGRWSTRQKKHMEPEHGRLLEDGPDLIPPQTPFFGFQLPCEGLFPGPLRVYQRHIHLSWGFFDHGTGSPGHQGRFTLPGCLCGSSSRAKTHWQAQVAFCQLSSLEVKTTHGVYFVHFG